jgi:hypothetical protein
LKVTVINVLNPDIESPELVRDRVLQAAEYIPMAQLGRADACGFFSFEDIYRPAETGPLPKYGPKSWGCSSQPTP